jgi:hypothetical protein
MQDDLSQVPVDPNEIYVTAAYFAASILSMGPDNSFLKALIAYKVEKDGSAGNARKTTSDFLKEFMEELDKEKFKIGMLTKKSYKFFEQASEETQKSTESIIAAKDGMYFAYNLFAVLQHVFIAQATQVKSGKLESSEFIKMVLASLNPIFETAETRLASRPKLFATKKLAQAKKGALDELIRVAQENFLSNFITGQSIQQVMQRNSGQIVQDLFDYCAEKEDDSISSNRPEKRTALYKVLSYYFMAITPEDFKNVFIQIRDGIQVSRGQGENGQKSRGAEVALIALRNQLFQAIFLNADSKDILRFTPEQLTEILDSMHYFNGEFKTEKGAVICDADVCEYALELLAMIPGKTKEEKTAEQVKLIKRLVLGTPDVINGEKIKLEMKAAICRGKGMLWAKTITALLEDPSLTEEQRKEVAVCGFVWNRFMAELGEGDANYYTPQIYVGFDAIRDHELLSKTALPVSILEELKAFCLTTVARVQILLAPRLLRQLSEAEGSTANPEEKSIIGLLESHIAENRNAEAIKLLRENVLDIGDTRHSKKLDKADHCIKLGPRWAQAISALLKSHTVSPEEREAVAVCGFVWNEYMLEKNVRDPQYYTYQHCVGFDAVSKNKLLAEKGFKKLKGNLDSACGIGLLTKKGNKTTHAQSMLASQTATTKLLGTLSGLGFGDEDEAEVPADEDQTQARLGVSAEALHTGTSGMFARTSSRENVAAAVVEDTSATHDNNVAPPPPPRPGSRGSDHAQSTSSGDSDSK